MSYRIASAVLGVWLFVSIGVWHHNPDRAFLDLVLGIVLFASGLSGIWLRSLRYFDAFCGFLLALSFFSVNYGSLLEGLHDLVLGLVVMALGGAAGRDGARTLDHWVSQFDPNPTLERRSLYQQELEG